MTMHSTTAAVKFEDEWENRYEELRASALGQKTREAGMLLFLQQGMSRWLHCLDGGGLPAYMISPYTNGTPASSGVAAILADAVLEIAGPVFYLKEEFNG